MSPFGLYEFCDVRVSDVRAILTPRRRAMCLLLRREASGFPPEPRYSHTATVVGSMLFIVGATVEYTVVNYLLRSQARIEKVVAKIKASKKADVASPDVPAEAPLQVEVIAVQGEVSGTVRAEVWPQLTKIDRLLVCADGTMRCKDEHLEVAARWLYPVAYSIFVGVHYASLPPAEQR